MNELAATALQSSASPGLTVGNQERNDFHMQTALSLCPLQGLQLPFFEQTAQMSYEQQTITE